MKYKLLNLIFNRYKSYFHDFLIEEMIGTMPLNTKEPSIHVLSQHKNILEQWIIWQAWFIQKKLVEDNNSGIYKGILLYLRFLKQAINKEKIVRNQPENVVKEQNKDPLDGVSKFTKGFSQEKKS